jgi:hypothetical protein
VLNQAHEQTPKNKRPLYSHFSLFDKSALPQNGGFRGLLGGESIAIYTSPPYPPNSLDRSYADRTASITADRNPAFSKWEIPAIVVPPGLVTRSFNSAG